MASVPPVKLLSRQYYQLVDPEQLTLPAPDFLRLPEVQNRIYDEMFEDGTLQCLPPERYRFRVLKRLEISDKLFNCLGRYIASPLPSASTTAQQKFSVTYSAPNPGEWAPQVTVLEARSLLASSGTTGFRTWEAALHLSSFLFSGSGREYTAGKRVLELGAGTGLLSIFCAKYLATEYVLATDGNPEVVNDIKSNALHNLPDGQYIHGTAVQEWGHALVDGIVDTRRRGQGYDLVLGADITYDVKSIPALIDTITDLFELKQEAKALISATVRNQDTLLAFLTAFRMNHLCVPA
ncbi:MAG: hypothetical protein Q9163_000552 [Psora crenata]